jgi:hypothetical protein
VVVVLEVDVEVEVEVEVDVTEAVVVIAREVVVESEGPIASQPLIIVPNPIIVIESRIHEIDLIRLIMFPLLKFIRQG